MHTTRYGREEKATTEESSKRDVSIFVASASTPLYVCSAAAAAAHCVAVA
jgi:hypothetical protein